MEDEKKITKHQLYFEIAPYHKVKKTDLDEHVFGGEFVGFNPIQKYRTTFTVQKCDLAYRSHAGVYQGAAVLMRRTQETFWDASLNGLSAVALTCKQSGDKMIIFFKETGEGVTKVGQIPSLADLRFAEVADKYEKQLSEEDLKNYKMAIFGHAHGVGIGSFVYLRRIFENLITETFVLHGVKLGIKAKDFRQLHMEKKVDALKSVLPSQLVDMKLAYGILSKGLHELTEEECLKYFLPIRLSIELILDQKIDRDKAIKVALHDIKRQVVKKAPKGTT